MKRRYQFNEDEANMYQKVALVERNTEPGGVALVSSVRVAKKSSQDLVDLAQEIQKADTFIHANACNKLQVIAQQVRFLQQQAQSILLEAKSNADLHHAACNFVKVPGSTYHLYKRPSGQRYFSMLSPEEWNSSSPHEFLGSFRLEPDQSWTPVQNIESRDSEFLLINKILGASEKVNFVHALQDSAMDET